MGKDENQIRAARLVAFFEANAGIDYADAQDLKDRGELIVALRRDVKFLTEGHKARLYKACCGIKKLDDAAVRMKHFMMASSKATLGIGQALTIVKKAA